MQLESARKTRPSLVQHTVVIGNRGVIGFCLTELEATAMADKGFHFSIFDSEAGRFDLGRPYEIAHNLERGTLTFRQLD